MPSIRPNIHDRRTTGRSAPAPQVVVFLAAAILAVLAGGGAAAVTRVATPASSAELDAAATPPAPARRPSAPDPSVVAPVHIDIPSLGVSAPVDEIGLLEDGTMAAPDDFGRTGWYRGLEAPGQVGTAVIVGHLDSHSGPAVFFKVPQLRAGDAVTVTRADDTSVRFVVDRTEQYAKSRFPTIAVYAPAATPSLRLITCGGTFDRRTGHYSDNVVVYAHLEEAA